MCDLHIFSLTVLSFYLWFVCSTHKMQNFLDVAKAVLTGKFTTINIYATKKERSQINKLILHFEELEKEQTKFKVSRKGGKWRLE